MIICKDSHSREKQFQVNFKTDQILLLKIKNEAFLK